MTNLNRWEHLEANLASRYESCEDGAATPSSILLAVLNAIADVNRAALPDPVDPMRPIPPEVIDAVLMDKKRVYFVHPMHVSRVSWTGSKKQARILSERGEAYVTESAAIAEAHRRWDP